MKFKVGDKVRSLKHRWEGSWWYGIMTINKITDGYIYCNSPVTGIEGVFGVNTLELVTEDKTSEQYLQSLVNKANEGIKAREELSKIASDRFEGNWPHSGGWQLYIPKMNTLSSLAEVRLSPPKPRERKFRLQDWDCVVRDRTINVGCKSFNLVDLKADIKRCENGISTKQFVANRRGINYDGHVLTWENADKLLAELEAFERGEV